MRSSISTSNISGGGQLGVPTPTDSLSLPSRCDARTRPAAVDGMVAARPHHGIPLSWTDVLRVFKLNFNRAGGQLGLQTGKARGRAAFPEREPWLGCWYVISQVQN